MNIIIQALTRQRKYLLAISGIIMMLQTTYRITTQNNICITTFV